MKKTVFAIILAVLALGLGVRGCRQVKPDLPPPRPPEAVLENRAERDYLRQDFHYALERELGLSGEELERLLEWLRWRGRNKTREERKAHRQELRDLLDEEQRRELRDLQRQRAEALRGMREAEQERLKNMIGQGDYAREQIDGQKRREQRLRRLEEQRALEARETEAVESEEDE